MTYKSTTRSLAEINHKLLRKSQIIETTISDLLETSRPLHVLEIGFGWGRALLELAWRFRNESATFYGVDVTKCPPMEKREDLTAIAQQFQLIPEEDLKAIELPHLFFYDAQQLHFEDESMDLIYSAVTIRFMERKAELLEEICRVLKPGGAALLHVGEANWNYPNSLASNDQCLTSYTSRLILKYKNELIPFPTYAKLFEGDTFRFQFTPKSRFTIFVKKMRSGLLNLRLSFNPALTIPAEQLPLLDRNGMVKDGMRTVYDIDSEMYQVMVSQGLLTCDPLPISNQIEKDADQKVS